MSVKNVRFKFNLHAIHSSGRRKVSLFVSLMFIIVLVLSCLFLVFNGAFSFKTKTPETLFITTTSETELRAAVNNNAKSAVITLDSDIQLTKPFIIPTNKNITLTSNNIANGFYKLIGANNQSAIIVETDGVLRLDGVVVTHEKGVYGSGVFVDFDGALILYSGVICNNTMPKDYMTPNGEWGGGVVNLGNFSMIGGEISSNTAYIGGGGVLNYGTFEMTGGKITGNTVGNSSVVYNHDEVSLGGGGVFNAFNFSMIGGEISGNTAEFRGGGVFNRWSIVSLDGGVICGNTASVGGGVYNFYGTVSMSGGVISDNVAWDKGGGVLNYFMFSAFKMSGGVISNNTAGNLGGGVCSDDEFNMSGGVISGNTANYGGGVYVGNGSFDSSGGKVSGNTASQSGNDVYYQK